MKIVIIHHDPEEIKKIADLCLGAPTFPKGKEEFGNLWLAICSKFDPNSSVPTQEKGGGIITTLLQNFIADTNPKEVLYIIDYGTSKMTGIDFYEEFIKTGPAVILYEKGKEPETEAVNDFYNIRLNCLILDKKHLSSASKLLKYIIIGFAATQKLARENL